MRRGRARRWLGSMIILVGLAWPAQALAAEPTSTPTASPTAQPPTATPPVDASITPSATATAQSVRTAPQSFYGLRDSLDAGYAAYYGGYYEQSGSVVTIRLRNIPATAQVQVGICTDVSFGSCLGWQPISNGSGSAAWAVTQGGTFYLAVWDVGPGSISYTGTLGV